MKTILILTSLLLLNLSAEAKQYVIHVNHISNLQTKHVALNTLLQKDMTIDTAKKTLTVHMSPTCYPFNICPEMLKIYRLNILKMDSIIQAEGALPLQPGSGGKTMITMEKNLDNATVVKIHDASGTSILIASPIKEAAMPILF